MIRKLALALILLNGIALADDPISTLSINGSAVLKKTPDQFNLNIAVITEADNAVSALQSNSQKMRAVIAALQAKELTSKEYATGQFNIADLYSLSKKSSAGMEAKNQWLSSHKLSLYTN